MAEKEKSSSGILLLGFGHPLLDITATVTPEFLNKYDLQADNAILGTDAHSGLVDDLVANFEVKFTPGGATQNAIRVAQWVLERKSATSFIGSIGCDLFGKLMKDAIRSEGVAEEYLEVCDQPTGTCAVLVTGMSRSLVSFPGAARAMQAQHLPMHVVRKAEVIYCAGFTIKSGFEAVLQLAQHAKQAGKIFCLNLSAQYVAESQVERIKQLLPLVDILFGNDGEVQALVKAMGWEGGLEETIVRLANHESKEKERCVVVTRGQDPVLVAVTGSKGTFAYPVPKIDPDEVVDTNCAGDAFVGGFLGHLCRYLEEEGGDGEDRVVLGHKLFLLQRCVKEGIFCAKQILRVPGCSLDHLWRLKRTE